MAITLSFLEAFKLFRDRQKDNRERIEAYLDEMVRSAEALVKAWKDAYGDLDGFDAPRIEHHMLCGQFVSVPNPSYHRLVNNFYRNSTAAFAGRMDEAFHNALNEQLAILLQRRDLSSEAYNKLIESLKLSYFSIEQKPYFDASILAACIVDMERGLADLKSAVAEYRARA